MSLRSPTLLAALGFLTGLATAQDAPTLTLEGDVAPGGVTHLLLGPPAPVSVPRPLLFWSASSLAAPLPSAFGDFYLGGPVLVSVLPKVPSAAPLDVPFVIPPVPPSVIGMNVVAQCGHLGKLSNPVSLSVQPSFLTTTTPILPGPTFGPLFGQRLAVGDLNNDQQLDLVLNAADEVNGFLLAGGVYILAGPQFTTHSLILPPAPKLQGSFGGGLLIADLNQDGVDDLVIGESPGANPSPTDEAHLYVHHGGAGFPGAPALTIGSGLPGVESSGFCQGVLAHDVDGDGFVDLITTPELATVAGQTRAGLIQIRSGPSFAVTATIVSPTPGVDEFFGTSVRLGDVDGDGTQDLVEASGRADAQGVVSSGVVHLYRGAAGGFVHLKTIESPEPVFNHRFGESIDVFDIDGDGVDEVVVVDTGKRRLYLLDGPDFAPMPLGQAPADATAHFGFQLAHHDFNQDGIQDLAVSDVFAANPSGSSVYTGAVFVGLGPYFATWKKIVDPAGASSDTLGASMVAADVDQDGVIELVVGAPSADTGGVAQVGKLLVIDG